MPGTTAGAQAPPAGIAATSPAASGAHGAQAEVRLGHFPPPDFPLAVRVLAAISRLLAVLEGVGIGACLLGLIGLATYQFVARNLRMHGFPQIPPTPDWIDGLLRHSVFLLGFLGAGYATFTARHIRIDAVTRMARPRARMVLRIITTAAAIAVCVFLIKASYDFLKVCQEEAGELAQKGQVFTSARGALVMIGGFGVVGFHFLVQLLLDIVWVASRRQPPASWVAEASHGEASEALVEPDAAAAAAVLAAAGTATTTGSAAARPTTARGAASERTAVPPAPDDATPTLVEPGIPAEGHGPRPDDGGFGPEDSNPTIEESSFGQGGSAPEDSSPTIEQRELRPEPELAAAGELGRKTDVEAEAEDTDPGAGGGGGGEKGGKP